jgi:carbonic anhydrase/acetyltransferase-like protein (isoleucine patch superfamily)
MHFISSHATVRSYGIRHPVVGDNVIVLDGARLIGDVRLGDGVSVWYNATIRSDVHWIAIGQDTNIQDNAVLHVTHDTHPLSIGERVTVGHGVRLHGCTIEDETLIGIGATVLDGAVVERHAMVAAGALVPPGMVVQSGTLVAGVPARVIRTVRPEEITNFAESAARYRNYALTHASESVQ